MSDDTQRAILAQDLTTSRASLLGLPLEVRHQIYAFFFKYEEDINYVLRVSNIFDHRLLRVCRQIYNEGWRYIYTSNKWMKYTVFTGYWVDTTSILQTFARKY